MGLLVGSFKFIIPRVFLLFKRLDFLLNCDFFFTETARERDIEAVPVVKYILMSPAPPRSLLVKRAECYRVHSSHKMCPALIITTQSPAG